MKNILKQRPLGVASMGASLLASVVLVLAVVVQACGENQTVVHYCTGERCLDAGTLAELKDTGAELIYDDVCDCYYQKGIH